MSKSIKENFFFNILGTISSFLFPLITFPYASRILLAEGIGQVQFFNSIINYVVLMTGLGIPMYAIREIARVRDDRYELTKSTVEIISLNLLLNILGYIAIAVICATVAKVQVNIPLFLILSVSIFLTSIGCPWFYQGIEDFKYVTISGIIFRLICAVFLFIVVKSQEDLLWYGLYTILGSIGNYFINFLRLRKFIDIGSLNIKEVDIKHHIKPAFEIFIFNLITSIYLNLDTVMLGFIKDSSSVGYYSAATKISHILLMVTTSLGAVLLPRSSNMVKNNDYAQFYELCKKSYNFILLLSLPLCFGLIVMAKPLIVLFCGNSFLPAIQTLRIISPIIVAVGISNLIGLQFLYPLGQIKLVTISTSIGAAVNVALNATLIPFLAQNGAAIATVVAECSVTATQFVLVRKIIPFSLIDRNFLRYFLSAIIMAIACGLVLSLISNPVLAIIVVPITGLLLYAFLLIIFKDPLFVDFICVLKYKFSHAKI